MAASSDGLVWRQLHWPLPLDPQAALTVVRSWAADGRSPRLILEARSSAHGVSYVLGGRLAAVLGAQRRLQTAVPQVQITELANDRPPVLRARRLRLSTRHRPLRTDDPAAAARAVLGALTAVHGDEQLVIQVVLGPRRIPLAVQTHSPSSVVMTWYQVAWSGNGGTVDGEKRSALRSKVSDHGFAATIRLGVRAAASERRRELLLNLFSALRLSEGPGVRLSLAWQSTDGLNQASEPWRYPLRLNASEVLALSSWPVGDEPLPGLPAAHPRRLPPVDGSTGDNRVVAVATAPGVDVQLSLPVASALHHLHVLGPTGTGKSTLLTNLICQDIAAGHGVVAVDPQGDLANAVLARVPAERREDIIVLDPATDHTAPVGLNPLTTRGRNPELVADGLLAVFKGLYGDQIGPRSQDILHAALLTLTRRDDASLVMLPLLLTNTGFRRSLTANLHDPIALGPFWAWYEALSDAERQAVTAPIQNKLRPWLLRPSLRNVLGQRQPKFTLSEVLQGGRVLLVSLAHGRLGPEGAALLGSLVVAELWQATLERARIPRAQRRFVGVYLDEFATFTHLPTDLADALARSRAMGVGYTLAHQFLNQLSPALRSSVLANARSRVCFQLAPEDAVTLARNAPELTAEDFTALRRYEVYASLFTRGQVSPYASGRTLPLPKPSSDPAALRRLSRDRYGQPLDSIERDFADLVGSGRPAPTGRDGLGRVRRAGS